jgi:hypothetical protein
MPEGRLTANDPADHLPPFGGYPSDSPQSPDRRELPGMLTPAGPAGPLPRRLRESIIARPAEVTGSTAGEDDRADRPERTGRGNGHLDIVVHGE